MTLQEDSEPDRKIRDHNGRFWTLLDHKAPYITIWNHMQDHTGPYDPWRTIRDHRGPNGTIQDHLRQYRTIREPMGPYWTIWDQFEYSTIQDHTGPNWTIWNHTGHSGHIGPNRTLGDHRGSYKTIWDQTGPLGTKWDSDTKCQHIVLESWCCNMDTSNSLQISLLQQPLTTTIFFSSNSSSRSPHVPSSVSVLVCTQDVFLLSNVCD